MRIPKHIGIIPDGNRRWAKRAGLEKQDGYAHGLKPGLDMLKLAKKCRSGRDYLLWFYYR